MSNSNRRFPFAHAFSQLLRVILPVAGLVLSSSVASAQDSGIIEGSRVQITVPGAKRVTGLVRSRSMDSTTVFVDGSGGVRRFLNSDITELRVSQGRSAVDGMKRGAIWGGSIGGALALLVLASPEDPDIYVTYSNNAIAAQSFIGGLIWGIGLGAITKAEHWDNIEVQPRFSKASSGVGLSVAFSPSFLH